MTDTVIAAAIMGSCTIIGTFIGAAINKHGMPFLRRSTSIRARGEAVERYAILPDGRFTTDEPKYAFDIRSARLEIGRGKAWLSATVTTTSGEVKVSDAELKGNGVFENGVAYITYHVSDTRNAPGWYGLLLLRVPGLGELSGYWIAEDHIRAGGVALGDVRLSRA